MSAAAFGFSKTPVTKALVLVSATTSFAVLSSIKKNPRAAAALTLSGLHKLELWRLLSCNFVCTTSSELFFGILLLYVFRTFERQFGSRKFASAVMFYITVATALQIGILYVPKMNVILPPGPYAAIFGIFWNYWLDVPSSQRLSLFNVPFTEKVGTYLMVIMFALRAYPGSLIVSCCGLLPGILYRSDSLPFRHWRLPAFLCNFCSTYLGPLLGTPPQAQGNYSLVQGGNANPRRARSRQPRSHNNGQVEQLLGNPFAAHLQAPRGAQPAAPVQAPALPAADETKVQQLVDMGFSRENSRRVLIACNNDVATAVTMLGSGR